MQIEPNPAVLLETPEGACEALVMSWLRQCREHRDYLASPTSKHGHRYARPYKTPGGQFIDTKQLGVIIVGDSTATLSFFEVKEQKAWRFLLNINGPLGTPPRLDEYIQSHVFDLDTCPIEQVTVDTMARNLTDTTFRAFAIRAGDPVIQGVNNNLVMVLGFACPTPPPYL